MTIHPKVAAGGLAGASTIILMWILSVAFPKIPIPPEVASAITTVFSAVIGWVVPGGEA